MTSLGAKRPAPTVINVGLQDSPIGHRLTDMSRQFSSISRQ
jgi:hypothetical protein